MNHFMVDIETLATDQDAAILSIGGVVFTPDGTLDKSKSIYIVVNLTGQEEREINPETLYWWMAQRDSPRRAIFNTLPTSRVPLSPALNRLGTFYTEHKCKRIWSHGSTFDIPILAHAYRSFNWETPWHWRDVRDTRTRFAMALSMGLEPPTKRKPGDKHHALGDAIRQAEDIITATQYIRKGGNGNEDQ